MSGTNHQIIRDAIAGYRAKIFDEVGKHCRQFCIELCQEAIRSRQNAPGAHDFTGNLITSIVVCLYKNSVAQDAWYASMYLKKAIRIKMRQRPVKKRYYFKEDYSGEENTSYTPPADSPQVSGRYGVDDAKNFFHSFRPDGNHLYDIVVAYPVEYADWVESHRATTGILGTYDFASRVGVQWLKLPQIH
jgi:hypothetical protein